MRKSEGKLSNICGQCYNFAINASSNFNKKVYMSFTIQQGRLVNVCFMPSEHFNDRPVDEAISLLVIHNISLPPGQYGGQYVEEFFTGRLNPNQHEYFKTIHQLKVSAHVFIRRTGEVIQFVPFDKRAWHAGESIFAGKKNCNDYSIGIELEGCDVEPFTQLQYNKLAEITRCLKQHYPINDIVGHNEIAPDRKTDPGPYFDWNYYNSLLN